MTLTVGSLFSGIGGLDLGLERAGMKVIWQSEIDPYCCKVLRKHWPEVPKYGNIKEIDWQTIERPDVICGGYPCQPFSQAGKRQGENDPRHLWPWVREAISALRPKYAILENVPGHRTLGGLTVIGELAEIGYDAEWRIVSAAGLGANHLRKRLIIVAYPNNTRGKHNDTNRSARPTIGQWHEIFKPSDASDCVTRAAQHWLHEPNVGRVADGIPHRVDRLRGLGNAVVPQVAEYIGRLITQLN
jgi:DNA (cytosine-5)-methyltransferase 1